MDFANSNYMRTLKNFELNKAKTINEIEEKINEAVNKGEWEVFIRGAIDKDLIKHLRSKGYRLHIVARFDAYGRDYDGYLYIKWDCGNPLKRFFYRIFGI